MERESKPWKSYNRLTWKNLKMYECSTGRPTPKEVCIRS